MTHCISYMTHYTSYITHYTSPSGYHGIHPAGMHGPGGILSFIAPRKTFTRNRRQAKRETRLWEKEERRRRTEVEEKKKKKSADYFRALLAHREEFVRFHKNKRIGKIIYAAAVFFSAGTSCGQTNVLIDFLTDSLADFSSCLLTHLFIHSFIHLPNLLITC